MLWRCRAWTTRTGASCADRLPAACRIYRSCKCGASPGAQNPRQTSPSSRNGYCRVAWHMPQSRCVRRIVFGTCVFVASLGLQTSAFAQLRTTDYVSGLSSPIEFVQDPTDATVQYVVEQVGRIRTIRSGVLQATPFLDVSPCVLS